MDSETYEETRLKRDEAWAKYLTEGAEVALLFWNGKVITVDPPINIDLEVTDTDPGLKGNTASGARPRRGCCCRAPCSDGLLEGSAWEPLGMRRQAGASQQLQSASYDHCGLQATI